MCSVVSDLCDPVKCRPLRFLCPWNFPGKSTGVGCHFLFQNLPNPGVEPKSSARAARLFTTAPPGKFYSSANPKTSDSSACCTWTGLVLLTPSGQGPEMLLNSQRTELFGPKMLRLREPLCTIRAPPLHSWKSTAIQSLVSRMSLVAFLFQFRRQGLHIWWWGLFSLF